MWKTYTEMVRRMPNGSMRAIDDRMKFPAYLLTYPQTKMTIDYAYRQLLRLGFAITEVVTEKHMDGGLHIHAMLISDHGKTRRLSPETATVGGERPNIRGKGKRAILCARRYIRKGFVEARGLQDLDENDGKVQRLLHQKGYEDAVKLWPGIDPKGYIYNRINGEIGLMMHYEKKEPSVYVSRYEKESFIIPNEILEWIDTNLYGECVRPKSLIIWGKTRVGKTQFTRAIGDHWYMNTDWDVSQVRKDALYGVIDDIPSERFMYWRSFLGCQEHFTVTDKFHRKKQLRWGKPIIWLSNYDPATWKGIDYEWVKGNTVIVEVKENMYYE